MEEHGFTAIAPVDIMDADGTMNLFRSTGANTSTKMSLAPILLTMILWSTWRTLKVMPWAVSAVSSKTCPLASRRQWEKASSTPQARKRPDWASTHPQDDFLESMAEAAKGVADYLGENILYINVMNNLSVDCDCDSHPADPTMEDIGILASLDPIALDQACVDLVYAAPDRKI